MQTAAPDWQLCIPWSAWTCPTTRWKYTAPCSCASQFGRQTADLLKSRLLPPRLETAPLGCRLWVEPRQSQYCLKESHLVPLWQLSYEHVFHCAASGGWRLRRSSCRSWRRWTWRPTMRRARSAATTSAPRCSRWMSAATGALLADIHCTTLSVLIVHVATLGCQSFGTTLQALGVATTGALLACTFNPGFRCAPQLESAETGVLR